MLNVSGYEDVYEGTYGHVTMRKGSSSQIMFHLILSNLGAKFTEKKPTKSQDGEMEDAATGCTASFFNTDESSFQSTILVFFFSSPDVDHPSVKLGSY